MKKIATLIIGILALLGCTKADPDPIIGTWKLYDYYEVQGGQTYSFVGGSPVKTWYFKEDGTGYINGKIVMDWRRDGSFLYVTDYSIAKTLKYEIITLNRYNLKVYWWDSPEDKEYWISFTPGDISM